VKGRGLSRRPTGGTERNQENSAGSFEREAYTISSSDALSSWFSSVIKGNAVSVHSYLVIELPTHILEFRNGCRTNGAISAGIHGCIPRAGGKEQLSFERYGAVQSVHCSTPLWVKISSRSRHHQIAPAIYRAAIFCRQHATESLPKISLEHRNFLLSM
jgi:hypothetical protein